MQQRPEHYPNPSLQREQRKREERNPRLVSVDTQRPTRGIIEVPCPQNTNLRWLNWRAARVEACANGRGVYLVRGNRVEDYDACPDPREWPDLPCDYGGSHDLLRGFSATDVDFANLAARINRVIDEEIERFVAERGDGA